MTKKKSTKNWLGKHTKDRYVKLSQASGYRSRAFHKLFDIDKKYKIIKSAKNIYWILDRHQVLGLSILLGIIVIKTLLQLIQLSWSLSRTSILSMEISTI